MSNICLELENSIEISNNKYILNENYEDITYGLFETSGNTVYTMKNIPKEYPLGFYSVSNEDISTIITYDISYDNPITIYVSKGSDISFNNNDYFRFYDESFNLINLSTSNIETTLTNSGDNFYFMRNMEYKFIATTDFSNIHTFCISGSSLSELSLNEIDSSFTFFIPEDVDNSDNKIFYQDLTHPEISGNLKILVDSSNINYYYGDIDFSIDPSYGTDFSNIYLSIKSYPTNEISEISNNNLFKYNAFCKYIFEGITEIATSLINDNKECFNLVSKANLKLNTDNNRYYYEFNTDNHGTTINDENTIKELDYGVYDGSYIIFNIDENFPITIINNDFINNIYIDDSYYRTNIINKSDQRIQNLNSPFNIYNYYYGAIKLAIDNSNNTINDLSNIKIHILDLSSSVIEDYDLSNTLFFTDSCTNPNNVNGKGTNELEFKLYNQKNVEFSLANNSDDIYKLNKYENYVDPEPSYHATDKYGHDISFLVVSNIPPVINYDLSNFIVSYGITDYEENSKQLTRLIQIQSGPFIEISGNKQLFNNSNPYTNIIELDTNTFDASYNFLKNIDVYIYDNSSNKINLPFEINLSKAYYDQSKNLTSDTTEIIKYDTELTSNEYDYYFSKNININANSGIIIENIQNSLYNNEEIFELFSNNPKFINFDTTTITLESESFASDTQNYSINYIDNANFLIQIDQKRDASNVSTSIYITNDEFKIIMVDDDNSSNALEISGTFIPIDFFDKINKEFIDLSYIGNYELTIIPKGTNSNDYLRNYDLSNVHIESDISRTFFINVTDVTEPNIKFLNIGATDNVTQYNYPIELSFNILTDICFIKLGIDFIENSNKPFIGFSDNSIYDVSLSYVIDQKDSSIISTDSILYAGTKDTSCTILYTGIDLCGNESSSINLELTFKDIPKLTLISDNPVRIDVYDTSYIDAGITLEYKGNTDNFLPNIDFSGSYSDTCYNYMVNDISYNIGYSTDLCLNKIGTYDLSYIVNKVGEEETYITRTIKVEDIEKPSIYFPDLSALSYIDGIQDSNYIAANSVAKKIYTDGDDFADFSLTIFSTFNDLSSIIYNYEISDNFFQDISLISNITLTISGNDVSFTYIGLSNEGYLNSDLCFNKVTKGIGVDTKKPLEFTYFVSDLCGNDASGTRTVNIVDVTLPTIELSFDTSLIDNSYVIPGLNNIDFSYQAFNYQKDHVTFLQEISSIIFNFDLSDNYYNSSNDEISNNFVISISGETNKYLDIKNISDISDNSGIKDLFSQINTTLTIQYDFSDNQYNTTNIIRKVDIINDIETYYNFS